MQLLVLWVCCSGILAGQSGATRQTGISPAPGQEGKTQLPSPAWLSSAPLQLVINSLSPEKTSRITKPNSSPAAFLELHHHKPKENEDFQPRVAARTLPQARVPPAAAEMGKAPGRTWKHGKDAGLPPPQQRGFAPASRGTSRPRDKGACYLLTPPGSGEAAGERRGKEAEQQTQRRRRKTRGLQPALKSPKKKKKKRATFLAPLTPISLGNGARCPLGPG